MPISSADKFYNETIAKMFLQFYEHTAQVVWNRFMEATWDYATNTTKKNQEHMVWYHLHPSAFSPALPGSLGGMGNHTFCLCPELEERGKPHSTCQSALQALGLLAALSVLWARISCFFPLIKKYHLLTFWDLDSLPSPSWQIFNDAESIKWAWGGVRAVAQEFSVEPLLPPPNSHGKRGASPSCTRTWKSPSTRCTLAARPACLRSPGSRTRP